MAFVAGASAVLSLSLSTHYKSLHGRSNKSFRTLQLRPVAAHGSKQDPIPEKPRPDEELNDPGVRAALSVLRFYRREISPLLLPSCRYVPSCSVYSMEAYKKYGFSKGTILTAWRLCRCNPLGGSGFDPPRWFGEESSSKQ